MAARLLGLALALLIAAPAAAERTLVIERFDAQIDVSREGTIVVEETLVARFTGSWNGIFRTIPIQYRNPQGLNHTLRLAVESVTDGDGAALRYESSRERHHRKLQVWVPGATDATRTVRLTYRVANGIRFFDGHDELYWNVTGDEWEAPIESASATVRLPDAVSGVRATAFRGVRGSTERASVAIEPPVVRVETRGLGFREGLTAAIGWDPGIVHRPTAAERTARALYSNLPLGLPPLVFAGMLWLWRARGRDPELAPITTLYEPPDGLTPAELGTLVDGRPDMRDITATLVDLAVRGYLRIDEADAGGLLGFFASKDYRFTSTRPSDEWRELKAHESDLLAGIFGASTEVRLSDLKDEFYKHLPGMRNDLYDMLVRRGFYTGRPDRVRTFFVVGGVGIGGLLTVVGGSLMTAFGMQPLAGIAAGILTGLVIVAFGWFMPSRTVRGTRELEKVLGFEEFLSRVEADRLGRMSMTPETFEKFLPYAMALGVEDRWAKAFEGIYREPPRWYQGAGGGSSFRPSTLTSNLGRMSAQAATVLSSAPRSSGGSGFSGGSSGGGSGGGGGGGF